MHIKENVIYPTRSRLSRCKRYLMRTMRCIACCNCFIGCFSVCGKNCVDGPVTVIELIDLYSSSL